MHGGWWKLTWRRLAQNSFPARKGDARPSALLVLQLTDQRAQLNDFERTAAPVMLPAHDHIATGGVVAVVQEIAAGVFELDPHPLPAIVLVIDAPCRSTPLVAAYRELFAQYKDQATAQLRLAEILQRPHPAVPLNPSPKSEKKGRRRP